MSNSLFTEEHNLPSQLFDYGSHRRGSGGGGGGTNVTTGVPRHPLYFI